MDKSVNNPEFEREVIYGKLSEISSKLEEEMRKNPEERDADRERELMFAQMIQGMKLGALNGRGNLFF